MMAIGKETAGAASIFGFGIIPCNFFPETVCPVNPIRVVHVISGLIIPAATVA